MSRWILTQNLSIIAILVVLHAHESIAQANYCNVNGVTHQVGQSWTTDNGNGQLKKCTCARRGQWNCAHVREDALMVVADVVGIAKIKISGALGFKTSFLSNLKGRTVSVDVDMESDTIYWSDVSYERRGIYKATFSNGRNVRRFITDDVYEPNGIAFDWLSKNIYWTDAQMRAIYVATETGEHKTMLVGGLSEPRGITVLPLHGLMFWTDQEAGTIESATMDGNDRRTIMAGLGWPNEIAVDAMRKVWRKRAVYSVTILGQDLKLVTGKLTENLAGIAIVNRKMQQAPISNSIGPCRRHRNPCSHICLPQTRIKYTCACPEKSGLVLSQDLHTCKVPEEFLLYTSVYDGSITIISKEFGTKPQPTLLTHSSQPSAIDYDPLDQMVYWSDVAMNCIYRISINGSSRVKFLEDGIGIVDGVAVDWVNRYLYFTNYGWESHERTFGRIEMIRLDGSDRKVLLHEGLDKPRDLVIDQQGGFLYYSDWGTDAKVVRVDLDGRNSRLLPIAVENPNGLALNDAILYVTDSHRKSTFEDGNGTITYGRSPSLITYDTALDKSKENMNLNLEIPFGLTMDKGLLYVTDWGKETISQIDVKTGKQTVIVKRMAKPTGIVRASLNPQKKFLNHCMKGKKCSHICVPVDQDYSSCLCPDHTGKALSEDESSCVAPDQFVLIADVNKIIMVSESPEDASTYMVVRTYDDYSNIVAFAYDPITRFVYWADNGRQRISRKMLASPFGTDGGTRNDVETIFTEIESVEGMALDPENRLLYWTDGVLGTIEVLDLSRMNHATVLESLYHPRAISLDPSVGVIYWTEWGEAAMLMSAKMNGGDARPLITSGLKWPNGLHYDAGNNKIYIADGAKLEIKSISSYTNFGDTSRVDALDYYNLNGTNGYIYGLSKLGRHLLFTDWKDGSVYKLGKMESNILVSNLARPTQIYAHTSTTASEVKSQCSTSVHDCSHICVPSAGSFKCLCPNHLVLANNLKNCVRPENLHLYTTTLAPAVVIEEEEDMTTAAWADEYDEDVEPMPYLAPTIRVERIPEPTTQENIIEVTTTTEMITTDLPTTAIETTTATTTTLPPPPRFPICQNLKNNETAKFTVYLPDDGPTVEISAQLLELRALNIKDRDVNVTIAGSGISRFYQGSHKITFSATDKYNRFIYCNATVAVKDVTPPKVIHCPADMDVESYDDKKTTFITWQTPKFVDNSGRPPIVIPTREPGQFIDGIHTVEYRAVDEAGNSATCKFMIAAMHRSARCGNPWSPPNSNLSCHSDLDTGDQICKVSCNKGYRSSLKTPEIRCREDLQDVSFDWLPFLDDNVCRKPGIGNPQQIITLEYICPCRPTSEYYDYTYQIITRRLREAIECQSRQHTLGLCMDAENKLYLECVEETTVELTITVDLGRLEEVDTMPEARRIVKRAVTDILDEAVAGQITARGSDMKDYAASEEARLSDVSILCKKGFKNVEDGCVECPRGTYWIEGDCEFCPMHTFQEKSGSSRCMKCSADRGTRNVGSTHRSHCIEMVRQENNSQPSVIVIAASVVGSIVILAIIISVFGSFWYRRKRRKSAKKEAVERMRKVRSRSHGARDKGGSKFSPIAIISPLDKGADLRAENRDSDGSEFSADRASKRSGSSIKRVTIKEETIEHTIPSEEEHAPRKETKKTELNWRIALAVRNKGLGKQSKSRKAEGKEKPKTISKNSRDSRNTERAESTEFESDDDKNLSDRQTRDMEEQTDTDATIQPEESDAAKRNNRLMSSTSDLGDETFSMTSGASSRATTPIKGVLKKPRRVSSYDESVTESTIDVRIPEFRGRDSIRRNSRMGSGRSASLDQGGNMPQLMHRSLSFDQGPGYQPRRMFDRDIMFRPNSPSINGPRHSIMPPMIPGMRQRFMSGPRIMNAPPPGALIYRHSNHPNIRMAFVPMKQAPRGLHPPPPPYGYSDFSDWESGSQNGVDADMRQAPRLRMPPPGMLPRFPTRHPYHTRIRMQGAPIVVPQRFPPGYGGSIPTRYSSRS